MSPVALTALVGLGFGIVVVRRRSAGVVLLALQSLLLGWLALHEAAGATTGLWVAASFLVVRGVALPVLLGCAITRTREPRGITSERFVLPRLIAAVAVTLCAVALVPPFGLQEGAEHAAVALVVLGILLAAVRRAVVFQAIGFLVAENGVFVAGLAVHPGIPAVIELGLLADLTVAIAVAAAFGARIHAAFGTGDTTVLRSLRD